MNKLTNKYLFLPLGVIIFAGTLAALLSSRLSDTASLIMLGMAVGLIIGLLIGMLTMWLSLRQAAANLPPTVTLNPEQSEMLLQALERRQTSPQTFGLSTRQSRQFSTVGGAELPATPESGSDAP